MQLKISTGFAISIIVILVVFFASVFWLMEKRDVKQDPRFIGPPIATQQPKSGNMIACTQEVKLCPDGKTYVSRTGSKCDFAACPSESGKASSVIDTSDWKTYKNDQYGFEFKYPSDMEMNVINHSAELRSSEIVTDAVGHTYVELTIARNAQKSMIVNDGVSVNIQKRENTNQAFIEQSRYIISKQDSFVGGLKAVKYVLRDSGGNGSSSSNQVVYVMEKSGYVYTIETFGLGFTDIANALASVFRFVQ